jgi:hypothetical protein
MSEAAKQEQHEDIDLEALAKTVESEVEESPADKPTLEHYQAAQEEKASKSGWMPFDEWVDSGKDPGAWKTADAFNTYGELVGQIKSKERDFEERLSGVNKINHALKSMLEQRKTEAIEAGDAQQVRSIEKEIREIDTPAPRSDRVMDEWNDRNPWIYEDSPKSVYAQNLFSRQMAMGKTPADALKEVDQAIAKHYPETKPQNKGVGKVPDSELSRPKGFNKGGKTTVTMADITPEERKIWSMGLFPDEKSFLQSVADSRKGA